jgi:TetR/AcrR family transcriptional regulator, transcriptional repressor for nem operon
MAATRPRRQADTAQRILDVAERLIQSRGFNGISYANVAAELSITKASLHYHFPGKAELGEALIVRYAARFADALEQIDGCISDARTKLDAYAALYADVLRGERMCLCGILAAEYETLPKPMRAAVLRFFDDNEGWLAGVLTRGQSEGTLSFDGSPSEAAQTILSGLEGAMLIARPYGDPARFQSAATRLLASFAN